MPHDRESEETRLRSRTSAIGTDSASDDGADEAEDEDWDEDEDGDEDDEAFDMEDAEEEWMSAGAWRQTGAAAAGLFFGLALGAGLALLFAPRAGEETRELIGDRARLLRGRAGERFDDLRDDLARLSRHSRRRMGRGVHRGRWAAEDMLYRAGW